MKLHGHLLIAAALLMLPACERRPNVNQTDGVKDAFDARPQEGIRDAAEQMGEAVQDAGRDIKNAVDDK